MRLFKSIFAVIAIVIVGGASGLISAYVVQKHDQTTVSSIDSSASGSASLASSSGNGTITSLVSADSPAVVSITSESTTYSYFGGPETEEGAGTGIIISSDGYILTNNHVVPSGTSTVTVTTESQKQYTATIVARNTSEDLALIKISAPAYRR